MMLLSAAPLTAFAWGYEGQVCSSKFGDRYVGADGQNYYSASSFDVIKYDSEGNVTKHSITGGNARKKYLLINDDGETYHVFCIESGVDFGSSDKGYTATSGTNSNYFMNLPKAAREGIMLTTVYGYKPGMASPVAGTNADDFALATQIILWEYQQQIRTSPTRIADNAYGIPANSYYRTIEGRPAAKCYDWILAQCAAHEVKPSFCDQTHTMKYDAGSKNFSITLTDTNNTYADIMFDNAQGIKVTRSGNKYTFTSSKMMTGAVSLTAHKDIPEVKNDMLIWGRPGKQTMMCGSEDPVVMRMSFKTEGYGTCKLIKTAEDGNASGIKFKITGNGVDKTVTTGADGTLTVSDLLPGTYTVTELTDTRYEEQKSKTVTIKSGQTAEVSFSNTLKRGDLVIEKACDDGLVEGLKFRVSASAIGYEKVFTTDADGKIKVTGLQVYDSRNNFIRYTVEEVDTPARYEGVPAQSCTIIYGGEVALKFNNTTKMEYAHISKVSEDGNIEGLKFRITSDNGYDKVYTTDENGGFVSEALPVYNTQNEVIRYTVTEVDTPVQFVQPESQSFTLTGGEVTLKFSNILKKFRVEVTKSDSETGSRAQGDASLAGAKYGLYKGGELVDIFTTNAKGYFITPYYNCDDDWELKEISPSEGYLIDPSSHHVGAEPGLYSVEHNTTENLVYEDVIKGTVAIIKHASDGSTQIEKPEEGATFQIYLASAGSFDNACESERDTLVCDEDGFAQSKALPYGRYIVHQTSGWEGTEYMTDFVVYISEHGEVYKYLINNAPFTSYLKIVKVDSETGKEIPYAGAGFQLYDAAGKRIVMKYTYPTVTEVDTFYTGADGYLITPERLDQGTYFLYEVQSPYGYTLRRDPIEFKIDEDDADYTGEVTVVAVNFPNAPQKGTVSIKKTGEVFSSVQTNGEAYLPIYEVRGLAGAMFNIIAEEDIITPDGTVRATKGTVMDTITTGADGTAKSKALYLGKYRIVEVESPYGMLLAEDQLVELVYAGQFVEITDVSASFYNERQKVAIELEKHIEKDELFGVGVNGEEANITFGLFAAEEIKAADGTVIPADGLIEIIRGGAGTVLSFKADIPFGSYYVKELSTAGPEYILDGTKYPVVFDYQGQEVTVVEIKLNEGKPIVNELLYGSVKGHKVDEFGKSLEGALIGLFKSTETEFTADNALMTDISGADGSFAFENIVAGHWLVAEIEQPEGFILSLDVHHIYVDTDGEVIPITMENLYIRGNLQLTKVDEDYPDNKLTGAEFKVYRDVNGDGLLDEDDVFVSLMEETEPGIYELRDIIASNYLIFESVAPAGFILDETVYTASIVTDGETAVIENKAGVGFINKAQRGTLVIQKSSEDGILEGFEFTVSGTDFMGNPFEETYKTDAEGKIELSMRPGNYTVSEKDDPDNVRYVLPDNQTVEIKADEELVASFENLIKTGSIELKKVDKATGEALEGVLFKIYDENEAVIAEGRTDKNGIVRFDGIKYGKYFWQEAETLSGYVPETSLHEFFVTEHGQVITRTVENEKIPDNPQTGDSTNLPLWFGLMGASLAGILGIVFTRKHRRTVEG